MIVEKASHKPYAETGLILQVKVSDLGIFKTTCGQ